MQKKDWNKEFKKLTASKGSDPSKIAASPYRDWRIVVAGFFIGLVALLGFNIYISFEINQDNFSLVTPKSDQGVSFNNEGLATVLEGLAAKETTFERLKIEGVPVVDPSL